MTIFSPTHTAPGSLRRRTGIALLLAGSPLALSLLPACGGDDLSCGDGTQKQGSKCVATAPISESDSGAGGADAGADGGDTDSGSSGATGTGGSGAGGVGTSTGGTGDGGPVVPVEELVFAGITSAAPANQTPPNNPTSSAPTTPDAIRVTWNPASYPLRPFASIRYQIAWSETAGKENWGTAETAPPGSTSFVVQGFADATKTQYFMVRAVTDDGPAADENVVEESAKPLFDDTPPTFAGTPTASPAGSSSVLVKWTAASDDHTPPEGIVYRVYWATSATGALSLGVVSLPGATEATVTGLPAAETAYFFHVVAVDAAGNTGANATDVSASTGVDDVPPTFGGCQSVSDPSASGATVVWSPATDDTTVSDGITYDVYASDVVIDRSTPVDSLLKVGTFVGGTTGRIAGLNADTRYRILCRATDAYANQDGNLAIQMITTKNDGAPPVFTGLDTIVADSTTVALTWPQATDNETANDGIVYNVYASLSTGTQDFGAEPILTISDGALGVILPKEALVKTPDPNGILVGDHVSNTDFFFVVRAEDEAANEDTNKKELTAHTLVSFADDVQPIFTQNCALATCHIPAGPPPQGQILAEGYAYVNIVDVVAKEGATIGLPDIKRIDSTHPEDRFQSYLYRKITGGAPITGSTMPPAAANRVLTPEQKETIGLWIDQGAKNN